MWLLAYNSNPSALDVGTWIMIAILLVPAVKVLIDWIKPPQVRPQPLAIRFHQEFVTKQELKEHKEDVVNQMKDLRAYVHEQVHQLSNEMQAHWVAADNAREGVHDRINALVKVTYEMRGLIVASGERDRRIDSQFDNRKQ